jgi:4-nitrophenyl phosphatase
MKQYKAYLLDLDGTLYRGSEPIPSAVRFVNRLQTLKIPYRLVTNNSTKTPQQVAEHLQTLGFSIQPEEVVTSAEVTAKYLQEKGFTSAYVIGEEGIFHALKKAGIRIDEEHPEAVIVGLDRSFDYEKMKIACLAIRKGAQLIGTNPDKAIPTEAGLLPGGGSLCMAISYSTGVVPLFIGKPQPYMLLAAVQELGVKPSEILMVGDNLETDIQAGVNSGVDTLLVLSGVTTKEMAMASKVPFTYMVESLDEWNLES